MGYIYKYLFYRIYSFIRKLDKDSPTTVAAHGSILLLTFIFGIDADFIIRRIEREANWDYKELYFFVIIVFIYSVNLLIFFKLSNYQGIESEFCKESHRAFIISTVITILFLSVATLPIFIS
jgi:hypothetical protein